MTRSRTAERATTVAMAALGAVLGGMRHSVPSALVLAFLAACSADEPVADAPARCVPGQTERCPCAGEESGVQACLDDGRFGRCQDCAVGTGSAGKGQGGSAGKGQAGSAGTPGGSTSAAAGKSAGGAPGTGGISLGGAQAGTGGAGGEPSPGWVEQRGTTGGRR